MTGESDNRTGLKAWLGYAALAAAGLVLLVVARGEPEVEPEPRRSRFVNPPHGCTR